MINITVPGRELLQIEHLVLDISGTITHNGSLIPGVKERLDTLQAYVDIHLLTADAQQTAIDAELGLTSTIMQHGAAEKGAYVLALGGEHTTAIGNSANDVAMFNAAALRIAVLGSEGLASALLNASDVLARDINDALDLLLNPQWLVATLRR